MIDTAGEFILILIVSGVHALTPAGIATETMPSWEACKAAQVQLEVHPRINAICIAKDVRHD